MNELTEPLSFRQLMQPRPKRQDYITPGFLPKSSKLLFGALAKTGKSWCSMELMRALATGTPVFGSPKFLVPNPVKVLLCDKELGVDTLQERLSAFMAGSDQEQLDLAMDNMVTVSGNAAFKFDAFECRKKIEKYLDSVLPNVLIVDPCTKFMQGSDSDNDDVKSFLEFCDILIEKFRTRTGLSIIFSHHFKKPSLDFRGQVIEPLSIYNFRGASKWPDDMDAIITMQRHDINKNHWRLECSPTFRHGASEEDFWLDVKPESEHPVLETVSPLASQPLKRKLLA